MIKDVVFIINLEKLETKKKESIDLALQLGLEPIVVKAVEPKDFVIEDDAVTLKTPFTGALKKYIKTPGNLFLRIDGRPVIPTEIACSFSHLKCAIEFLSSTNLPYCLVFEDDNIIRGAPEKFRKELEILKDNLVRVQYANFGQEEWKGVPFAHNSDILGSWRGMAMPRCIISSSSSYLMTREFAKIMIDSFNAGIPSDHFQTVMVNAVDRGLVWVLPHPVLTQNPKYRATSTIEKRPNRSFYFERIRKVFILGFFFLFLGLLRAISKATLANYSRKNKKLNFG